MTPEAIKAMREALEQAVKNLGDWTPRHKFIDDALADIGAALALLAAEQAKAPPSSMDEILQKQFDRSRLTPSPRPATAAGIIDYPEAGAQAAKAPPDDTDEIIGEAIAKAHGKWEPVDKAPPDRDWIGPFGPQDIDREARAGSLEIYADGVEALEKRVKGEEWLKALAIALREAVVALRLSPVTAGECEEFQSRVADWMIECFGAKISGDRIELNHRFIEEALELVQACGCTKSEAYQLVDYVYDRPQGDINQEVGGVMVTLAALCLANGFDMHAAGEKELARVWTKIEKIRAKHAAKPRHSPLPEVLPPSPKEAGR